jgi:hypothetical protein
MDVFLSKLLKGTIFVAKNQLQCFILQWKLAFIERELTTGALKQILLKNNMIKECGNKIMENPRIILGTAAESGKS